MRTLKKIIAAFVVFLSACTPPPDAASAIIERFLSARDVEREQAVAQDYVLADVDGKAGADIVLVWTILGPTYSRNMLTVFPAEAGGYSAGISHALEGHASLEKVENGAISIDQLTLDDDDPMCCPTLKKPVQYKVSGDKLTALTQE